MQIPVPVQKIAKEGAQGSGGGGGRELHELAVHKLRNISMENS